MQTEFLNFETFTILACLGSVSINQAETSQTDSSSRPRAEPSTSSLAPHFSVNSKVRICMGPSVMEPGGPVGCTSR